MPIRVQTLESSEAAEVFITAAPSLPASIEAQAVEVFSAVRDALRAADARLLEERVFAPLEAFAAAIPEAL